MAAQPAGVPTTPPSLVSSANDSTGVLGHLFFGSVGFFQVPGEQATDFRPPLQARRKGLPRSFLNSHLGVAKAAAGTETGQEPPSAGQGCRLGDSTATTHPDGRGHVIRTHLGEVPLQHPVVKTVEEEGDAKVHGVFGFDSATEEPKRHQEHFWGLQRR